MTTLLLATAFALLSPGTSSDTVRIIPPAPISRSIGRTAAVPVSPVKQHTAFGPDKLQHVSMTWAITAFGFAAARSAGIDRDDALVSAAGVAAAAGIGKELFDRRRGGPFSGFDLLADALGGAAAYAVLKQVR